MNISENLSTQFSPSTKAIHSRALRFGRSATRGKCYPQILNLLRRASVNRSKIARFHGQKYRTLDVAQTLFRWHSTLSALGRSTSTSLPP
jgi:hypothetical protein